VAKLRPPGCFGIDLGKVAGELSGKAVMRLSRHEPGYSDLARLRDEGDLEALARYLNDPKSSRRLRRRVVTYIASTKPGGGKATMATGATDPAIIPILAPTLHEDPDPSVRRAAAYGLRRTGDQGAVQPLLGALSDTDKATRVHAAMGLGDLRSRAAVEPLSQLLTDHSCAETAAGSLVVIGDEQALTPLRIAASSTRSKRMRKKFDQAVVDLERRVGLLPSE
jgi:HEAT repeat protein